MIRALIILLTALGLSACGQPRFENAALPQKHGTYAFAVELAAEECDLYDGVCLNEQGFREFAEAFAEAASDEELLQADRCLHEQLLDWEE